MADGQDAGHSGRLLGRGWTSGGNIYRPPRRRPALAVWWIRLGIRPDLIEPGAPQQNGCHEYNTIRPHEALADATPASRYTPSPRPYPARLAPLEYPGHYEVRRVGRNGGIRWHKQWVNVSQTLGEEYVGLVEVGRRRMGRLLRPAALGPIP